MESFLKKGFKKHKAVGTDSVNGTKSLARAFAGRLKPGDTVALSGDLGAGKTHFVKGVAAFFGINEKQIVSPTFSLMKTHRGKQMQMIHFDFYRLKGLEELEKTGYRESLSEDKSIVFVEWPEIIKETWDDFTYMIRIEHAGDKRRSITIYKKNASKPGVKTKQAVHKKRGTK